MKNRGFKNEKRLINALNGKYFEDLNKNLKKLITKSFKNTKGMIQAKLIAQHHKSDMQLSIGHEVHTYSIKMGKGNSIHQESLSSFVKFLETQHGLKEPVKSYLQEFIWGDKTKNGLGKIEDRLSARQFKKNHPKKIAKIQAYFEPIKRTLIRRFLLSGRHNSSEAEYLYYGTVKKGNVCKTKDAILWLSQQRSRGVLSIGKLNLQAWNRNLKGKAKAEHKRGFVQIKWSGLQKDIQKIAQESKELKIRAYHLRQLFQHSLLALGASLHTHPKKHALNEKVIKTWKVSEKELRGYYVQRLPSLAGSAKLLESERCLQEIQSYAQTEIIKVIQNTLGQNQAPNYHWRKLQKKLLAKSLKQPQIRFDTKPEVVIVFRNG